MTTEAGQAVTQEEALLRAICNNPGDDTPRLVYADLLDERGEPERAEFVRVQCELARIGPGHDLTCQLVCAPRAFDGCPVHAIRERERKLWGEYYPDRPPDRPPELSAVIKASLPPIEPGWSALPGSWAEPHHYTPTGNLAVVRRGFVDEIRLPLAAFVGGPCGRCDGTRHVRYYHPVEIESVDDCPDCKGEGEVEGLARRLFSQHPITRVVLTDREPDESFWWWRDWDGTYRNNRAYLPSEIFNSFNVSNVLGLNGIHVDTREAALAALSAACVAHGRSKVDWLRAYDERKVAACRRGTTGG